MSAMTANEFCRPSGSPTPAKLDADPPDAIRVDRDPENIHGVFDCADSADPADRCGSVSYTHLTLPTTPYV